MNCFKYILVAFWALNVLIVLLAIEASLSHQI